MKTHQIDIPTTGVGYGVSKADAAKGIDVYVDDDLDKLLPLVGVVQHLFLFGGKDTVPEEMMSNIIVVNNWLQLIAAIKEIQTG